MSALLTPDCIVPVPREVSRRAWECGLALRAEHSSPIGSPAPWRALQAIVMQRDPETLTWAECGMLFRAHRALWPVRT